jgi:hypothetical protein
LKVVGDPRQVPEDVIDKGLGLARLLHDKVPPALLRDFDERVARHVLHACTQCISPR